MVSFAGFAVAGLCAVRRLHPAAFLEGLEIRTVAAIFSATAALLALLLAFVVVTLWQNFDEQSRRTVEEAALIGSLYRTVEGLDPAATADIRALVRRYTETIVSDSWPMLREGRESSEAGRSFNDVYERIIRYSPSDRHEEIVYQSVMGTLERLAAFRRLRLHNGRTSLPTVVPVMLLVMTLASISFTYLLQVSSPGVHALVVGLYVAAVGGVVSLMVLLDYPYRSSVGISSEPFERLANETFPSLDRANR
jgi:hypothetical protein